MGTASIISGNKGQSILVYRAWVTQKKGFLPVNFRISFKDAIPRCYILEQTCFVSAEISTNSLASFIMFLFGIE